MNNKHTNSLCLLIIAAGLALFAACNNTPKEEEQPDVQTGVTPYTWNQQLFCLNMLSNISAHYQGQKYIGDSTTWAVDSVLKDPNTQKYLGQWNLVWGPVVFHGLTDTPANTMFIAQLGTTNNYVVAIAGTDPTSTIADIWEDAEVLTTQPWASGTGNTGRITQGTYDGFVILRDVMKSGKLLLGAREFLATKRGTANNIYVTGHSLGGALAPVYALYLSDTKDSLLGVGSKASIYCLPVAGATPGDSLFSVYYNSQLGSTTTRVWNQLDVVPHAYQPGMLAQISNLYLPQDTIPPSLPVKGKNVSTQALLLGLEILSTAKGYYQLYPPDTVNFKSGMYQGSAGASFIGQMLGQHVPAYATFFGVDSFQVNVQRIVGLANPMFSQGYPYTAIASYDTAGKNFNRMSP